MKKKKRVKRLKYMSIVWYNFQAGIVFKTLMPKYKILHLAYLTKWNSHLLLISSNMSTCSYRMSIAIMTRISKINKENFHTNYEMLKNHMPQNLRYLPFKKLYWKLNPKSHTWDKNWSRICKRALYRTK